MQDKKRLSINIVAQIVSFTVQFGINFFLTPFIVGKLGTEAYGFIGLSNDFISYAQILTVALNSMAGRFIAVEYHKGNIENSKKYFTSVFYANIFLAGVITLCSIACTYYLEFLINIPDPLIVDVKLLFILLVCNFLVSIVFSVYNVATFIKNRLDYVAVRSIIGNVLRAGLLTAAFAFLIPKLWYVGFASLVCTIYLSYINIQYKRKLTPDLNVAPKYYCLKSIKDIIKSGVWNAISRLSRIIEQGFNLLFANLFISSYAMGQLAITRQIPVIILSLIGSIGPAFAPSLTKSFANSSDGDLKKELIFSVKLMGFFSVIPMCFIFVFIDAFFELWLPNQDSQQLYYLTIISCAYFPILLSLEGVQNLWPVLDKVKTYSLASITSSICSFITLFIGIHFISDTYSIFYLVGVSTFYSCIFALFFIPIYASHCLQVSKTFFYPSILKVLLTVIIVTLILIGLKYYIKIDTWFKLIICGIVEVLISIVVGYTIILDKTEKRVVRNYIQKLL